jgi:hypothetical protein
MSVCLSVSVSVCNREINVKASELEPQLRRPPEIGEVAVLLRSLPHVIVPVIQLRFQPSRLGLQRLCAIDQGNRVSVIAVLDVAGVVQSQQALGNNAYPGRVRDK